MESSKNKVGPLKKVTLGIEAGRTRDLMDLTSTPIPFEFIFGVGVQGLSPFEKALDGKSSGMVVFFQILSRQAAEMFVHLKLPVGDFICREPLFFLKTTIARVARPEDREVVAAMARGVACDHGNCGCGCG